MKKFRKSLEAIEDNIISGIKLIGKSSDIDWLISIIFFFLISISFSLYGYSVYNHVKVGDLIEGNKVESNISKNLDQKKMEGVIRIFSEKKNRYDSLKNARFDISDPSI